MTTPVFVLHAPGDASGGSPWAAAFEAAGWRGPVLAPDLPGHAGAPAPTGGNYEPMDGVYAAIAALANASSDAPPVVVGVDVNAWPAHVLALAGRAAGVVLVDGLGGPWLDPRSVIHRGRDWLRAIAADEEACAPPPPGAVLDPRLRHGLPAHHSRRLVERAAAATPVPVLLVESERSAMTASDVEEVAGRFAAGASVVRVRDCSPDAVAAAAVPWWEAARLSRPA